ncbi:iron-siderophore ABC transporter substrate-binding protein [Paenibacillus alkaliterrae]|uniref:ABC transporter substrate-binding protein n=1 Tax=Paenibacillus alkaliterrae TaxID=320909 RepID=UPI001F4472A5|nr:iron-siderophore ABC transporter substrate-binding protein [Paenibacillus alkaliterrae]MCF2938394.1 iron-siderophore ABC transporter substrate-binding protein [Paenibacillus alkaliterrae]
MKRSKLITILLAVMVVFLAACGGTTNEGNNTNTNNQGTANAGQTNNAGGESNGTGEEASRMIKHAMGEAEITGTPKKIVVLEWTYAEDLLALGVQPAGVTDIENYNVWYGFLEEKLDAAVVELGTRQEPSIETITSLAPDLIIGVKFRHEAIYDQLNAIAPTLIFNPYPEEGGLDQYSEMEETFRAIADALNKKDEGEKVLADLQAVYDDAKGKLSAAGKEGHEVVMTQAWSTDGVVDFRLFTDNSMAMAILAKIGLKNAHQDSAFQMYGYTQTTLEALTKTQQASLLYTVSPTDPVFSDMLPKNKVYNELQFVKENRLYDLAGIWPFGGPKSAELLANKVTELLAK